MHRLNSDYKISIQNCGTFFSNKKVSSQPSFNGKFPDDEPEVAVDSKLANTYFGVKEKSMPVIRKLTDEEFEEMRAKVQLDFLDTDFNKYNVQIADKILSDKKLLENPKVMRCAEGILGTIDTPYKAEFANKMFSDPNLYDDACFRANAGSIIKEIDSHESAQAKIDVIDKVYSDKSLYGRRSIMRGFINIVEDTETPEIAKTKIAIMDKILSDERLKHNEVLTENAVDILKYKCNISDEKALNCLFDMVADFENKNGRTVPKYDVEDIIAYINYYQQCPKFLTNDKLRQFVIDNSENIYSVKSLSSENYAEIQMHDKTLHIKADGNEDYEIISEEKKRVKGNTKISELKTPDGSIKLEEYVQDGDKIKGYVETIKDKDGNVISRTLTKPDKKNPYVLVVIKNIYDKDGNIIESKQAGTVKNFEDAAGRRKIQKEFVSPLGVVTKQTVYELKRGKQTHYEAGDKIFNRTFKIKDENTTESHVWGKRYETKFNNDSIEVVVTKPDGKTKIVKLDGKQIDLRLMPLLKQLPGDFFYMLSKTGTSLMRGGADKNNACFDKKENTIKISEELKNDPFSFAHEYGHMLDHIVLNELNSDKELKKVFQKELDAYKLQASGVNEEQIEYFVARKHKNKEGCLTEVIAETNALLSGLQPDNSDLLIRAKILQENFPETISYIGSKIEAAM